MTVILGKTHINLGWQTAGAIVLFLVVTTWKLGNFTYDVTHTLADIKTNQSQRARKDSIYDSRLANSEREISTVKRDVSDLQQIVNTSGYVTETRVKGKIHIHRYNN